MNIAFAFAFKQKIIDLKKLLLGLWGLWAKPSPVFNLVCQNPILSTMVMHRLRLVRSLAIVHKSTCQKKLYLVSTAIGSPLDIVFITWNIL